MFFLIMKQFLLIRIHSLSTHWGRGKMSAIFQTFSNAYSWMKVCILVKFDEIFIEICFPCSNQQYSLIDSNNGLAPARPQAIIWTNDGLF